MYSVRILCYPCGMTEYKHEQEKVSDTLHAAWVLRHDVGPFKAGTPATVIREYPNGAVGVVVNGNAFTVRIDDLEEALPTKPDLRLIADWKEW
jgi:hypothetical protein